MLTQRQAKVLRRMISRAIKAQDVAAGAWWRPGVSMDVYRAKAEIAEQHRAALDHCIQELTEKKP